MSLSRDSPGGYRLLPPVCRMMAETSVLPSAFRDPMMNFWTSGWTHCGRSQHQGWGGTKTGFVGESIKHATPHAVVRANDICGDKMRQHPTHRETTDYAVDMYPKKVRGERRQRIRIVWWPRPRNLFNAKIELFRRSIL